MTAVGGEARSHGDRREAKGGDAPWRFRRGCTEIRRRDCTEIRRGHGEMAHRGAPLAVCEADAQFDGAILVRLGGVALGGVVGDEGGGRRLQV